MRESKTFLWELLPLSARCFVTLSSQCQKERAKTTKVCESLHQSSLIFEDVEHNEKLLNESFGFERVDKIIYERLISLVKKASISLLLECIDHGLRNKRRAELFSGEHVIEACRKYKFTDKDSSLPILCFVLVEKLCEQFAMARDDLRGQKSSNFCAIWKEITENASCIFLLIIKGCWYFECLTAAIQQTVDDALGELSQIKKIRDSHNLRFDFEKYFEPAQLNSQKFGSVLTEVHGNFTETLIALHQLEENQDEEIIYYFQRSRFSVSEKVDSFKKGNKKNFWEQVYQQAKRIVYWEQGLRKVGDLSQASENMLENYFLLSKKATDSCSNCSYPMSIIADKCFQCVEEKMNKKEAKKVNVRQNFHSSSTCPKPYYCSRKPTENKFNFTELCKKVTILGRDGLQMITKDRLRILEAKINSQFQKSGRLPEEDDVLERIRQIVKEESMFYR